MRTILLLKNIQKLMLCFPKSYVNYNMEFIAHQKSNTFFRLEDCERVFDIKCKVLEWLSRSAYKTICYRTDSKNEEFHEFILTGINRYLGTNFSNEDIKLIYTYLGNMCNRPLTEKFIIEHYDISVLKECEGI